MNLTPLAKLVVPDWATANVWADGDHTVVVDVSVSLVDEVVFCRRAVKTKQLEQAVDPHAMLQAACDCCVEELKQHKEKAQCAVN